MTLTDGGDLCVLHNERVTVITLIVSPGLLTVLFESIDNSDTSTCFKKLPITILLLFNQYFFQNTNTDLYSSYISCHNSILDTCSLHKNVKLSVLLH